jgi:hypothetical protein
VENYMVGVGAIFDPESGVLVELEAPDPDEGYMLSRLPEGVTADGQRLVFSGEGGDGLVDLASGVVTRLSVTETHASSWMALDPAGWLAAVVMSRPGEDNRVGAGVLSLFDAAGYLTATVTTDRASMDWSPAWAGGGAKLAFLRSPAGLLRTDPGAYGSDLQEVPAALTVYDLATGAENTIPTGSERIRDVLVPGAGDVIVFRQLVAGSYKAFAVPLAGGEPVPLLVDDFAHTAVAAPRPQ